MDSHKRPRSVSPSSSTSSITSDASDPASPTSKAIRPSSPPPQNYTCTLPPSCDRNPQSFTTASSLETHWRTYHAFVCNAAPSPYPFAQPRSVDESSKGKGKATGVEMERCGRVFPDERILNLHLTECHDSLAQLRLERGEKIVCTRFLVLSHFACLHPTCQSQFLTPKTRRLHLISTHSYPKEYFFGVIIWGVGQVLEKGGGMVRREWRPRPGQPGFRESASGSGSGSDGPPSPVLERDRSLSPLVEGTNQLPPSRRDDLDDLTDALQGTSIGFVPRAVRKAVKNKMMA